MEPSAPTRQAAADSGTAQDGVIRPFSIEILQAGVDELRLRITATRLLPKELVDDRSQGVQLATIQVSALEVEYGRRLVRSSCHSLCSSGLVQDLACALRVLPADHDVVRSHGAQPVSSPGPAVS